MMKWRFWKKDNPVEEKKEFITDEKNIVGVTLSWGGSPTLCFKGGWILPKDVELWRFPQYYKDGLDWPRDPVTGEKMPIAHE